MKNRKRRQTENVKRKAATEKTEHAQKITETNETRTQTTQHGKMKIREKTKQRKKLE